MNVALPAEEPWSSARLIADALLGAGFETYLVGGCVRDLLLERPVTDVDLATAAHPEQVESVCAARGLRTIAVGKAFGVVVVVSPSGTNVEVASFRNDGQYVDGRRPSSVSFSTAREDVERRDFTINALLMDPRDGRIVDHVGGLDDLRAKKLRAVGDAAARLREDRLRVLRAVRFAAHLGLWIERETWAAMQATDLAGLSGERLMQEWHKGLGLAPAAWVRLLGEAECLADFCPPLAAVGPSAAAEAARSLERLPNDAGFVVRAALFLRPCAHAEACAWLRRQPLAKVEIETIAWLLDWAGGDDPVQRWIDLPPARRWRELRGGWPQALAQVLDAALATGATRLDLATWIADPRADRGWKPLLRASDLLALGFVPGPALGRALTALEDAELDGHLSTREQALERAHSLQR